MADHWTDEETNTLKSKYRSFPRIMIEESIPDRTWQQIITKANRMGIKRVVVNGKKSYKSRAPEYLELEKERKRLIELREEYSELFWHTNDRNIHTKDWLCELVFQVQRLKEMIE